MAVGVGQPIGIGVDFGAQRGERVGEPILGRQIAAQPAGDQQAAQKAAAGQPRIQLLQPLLEQFALGLADLERRRVRQMAEVMQVVVEAFQFRQQARASHRARGGGEHSEAASTAWQ